MNARIIIANKTYTGMMKTTPSAPRKARKMSTGAAREYQDLWQYAIIVAHTIQRRISSESIVPDGDTTGNGTANSEGG